MRFIGKYVPILIAVLVLIFIVIRIASGLSAYLLPTTIPLKLESQVIGSYTVNRSTIFFDHECITFDWDIDPDKDVKGIYFQWSETFETSETVCPLVQDLPMTWPLEVQMDEGNVFVIMDIPLYVNTFIYVLALIILTICLIIYAIAFQLMKLEGSLISTLKQVIISHPALIILSILTLVIYTEFSNRILLEKIHSIYFHALAAYNLDAGLPMTPNASDLPHKGFFVLLSMLNKIGITYFHGATLVLTLATLFTLWITFAVLRSKSNNKVDNSLIAVIAFVSIWLGAIHIPFDGFGVYFGQGSPNVHHNSTLVLMKPFIILVFFYFIATLETPSYGKDIFASICMTISTYIKPTFGLVFFPVIGLYILYKRNQFKRNVVSLIILVVPTLLLLVNQYLGFYGETGPRSIAIRIFDMWQKVSPNIPISIIAALAFPILVLFYRPEKSDFRKYFYLAWLVTLLGMLQFILFVEADSAGNTIYSANWLNGYLNGMMILYPVAFIAYIGLADGYLKKNLQQPLLFWVSTIALVLHIYGGILFLQTFMFSI